MAKLTEPMKMNEDVESWLEILEQAIEHLLIMEDITDSIRVRKVKVSCLITNIGPDGYKLLKSYCAPRLPKNLEFEELVRLLKDNLVPKPVHSSRLQMTFQFEQMKQESKESLGMFMSRLTQQANLGCLPDIMVRNRFLNGMKNQQVQSYLLTLREDDVNTSNQVLEKAAEKENKIFEEKIKQKNSLTEEESLCYLYNAFAKEGKNVLNKFCKNEWDGYSVMLPPIPNPSKHIDLMQRDNADMSNNELMEQKSQIEYEAEVVLFRALEGLQKSCVVLHGFKYDHLMLEAVMPGHPCSAKKCKEKQPHPCHRQDNETEGEADFIIMGKNYFATFEVKHCKVEKIAKDDNLVKGIQQTERTEALLKQVMELTIKSSRPMFKFCAFPLIKRDEVLGYLTDRLQSNAKLLFKEDFEKFNNWWDINIENKAELQFNMPINEGIKEIIAGLSSKISGYNLRDSIRLIDENLRRSIVTREFKKGGKTLHNNTEIIHASEEFMMLDINYLRRSQKAALDDESDRLIINGPAGTGKTIILQGTLLKLVQTAALDRKVIVFAFGQKAALGYAKLMEKVKVKHLFQRVGNKINDKSSQKIIGKIIGKIIESSTSMISILQIDILDYSKRFLEILIGIIEHFQNSSVLIDDIQCLLTPNSAPYFEELIKCISRCKYVRITIDAVQLFHHPKTQNDVEVLDKVLRGLANLMKIVDLQSNMRNSYEISSLLMVVREQFRKTTEEPKMVPSQKFAHYIHGPKTVIHYIKSVRGAKLNEKINEILRKEVELLSLRARNSKNGGNEENQDEDYLQIVRMSGQRQVKNKRVNTRPITIDVNLEEYSEKIRYSYSREWPAVVGLIAIDNKTIYREFLSWVYIAVSRARVYSSLILYVENTGAPEFLTGFLETVQESSTSTIVKKYVLKRFLPRDVKSASALLSVKLSLDEDQETDGKNIAIDKGDRDTEMETD